MFSIFGKNRSDKIIVLYNTIFFIITLYFSMLSKKINDEYSEKNNITAANTYSFIHSFSNYIYSNNTLYKIHDFMNKYNFTYIPIFLITFIWIFFYSKMSLKILKRYLIICSLYTLFNSINLISTFYYKSYKYCNYNPSYYDLWGLFRCYTYKENLLLYSLIMLYIFNRYHTSQFIRVSFILLNFLNLYLSLIEKQIFINQVIESIVISFLFWSLYDNPYYFKNSKKNDIDKEKIKRKRIELEIQKSKLYENVININDF